MISHMSQYNANFRLKLESNKSTHLKLTQSISIHKFRLRKNSTHWV